MTYKTHFRNRFTKISLTSYNLRVSEPENTEQQAPNIITVYEKYLGHSINKDNLSIYLSIYHSRVFTKLGESIYPSIYDTRVIQ